MKLFITLLMLFSTSVFAGQRTGIYKFNALSEDEAVERVQELIPEIKRGAVREVNIFGRRNQCTFRVRYPNSEKRIKVIHADIKKMYKILDNDKLERYYDARITFRFLKCKR